MIAVAMQSELFFFLHKFRFVQDLVVPRALWVVTMALIPLVWYC